VELGRAAKGILEGGLSGQRELKVPATRSNGEEYQLGREEQYVLGGTWTF